jgi:CheY-like chemotaxis protein
MFIREKPYVLIVDDNEDLRSVYQMGVESAGFPTVTACDGIEGLKVLSSLWPCIVLLDINMPEMDGIQFLEHLSWQPMAVIAMSADPRYALLARQKGAYEFIEKPIRIDHLITLIEQAAIGQPASPELRAMHLSARERRFAEDDVRRVAILVSFPSPDPTFQRMLTDLLAWVAGYFGVPISLFSLLRGGELEIYAAYGNQPGFTAGTRLPCDDTHCAGLIRTDESIVVKDALVHPVYFSHPVTRAGVRFCVSVPVRVEKNFAIGTLSIESFRGAEFFTEDLRALRFFADALGALARVPATPVPTHRFFPDPVFLDRLAVLTLLESRIARNRRLGIADFVGFFIPFLDDELENRLTLSFRASPKGGVFLGKGSFGWCGFGPRKELEHITSIAWAKQPRSAPTLFDVRDEIPTVFTPLLRDERLKSAPRTMHDEERVDLEESPQGMV